MGDEPVPAEIPVGLQHVVAPGAVVELDPVARFVSATGGNVSAIRVDRLPIASTSLWTRPARSDWLRPEPVLRPLQLHFDVKAALGFEQAVVSRLRIDVVRPTRLGDRVGHHQQVRSVGPERTTALGPGRTWEVDHVLTDADGDVLQIETFTAVGYRPGEGGRRLGTRGGDRSGDRSDRTVWSIRDLSRAAAACRVWAPVHHDPDAARRAGLPGVIACTQHLAAIAERADLADVGSGRRPFLDHLDLRMSRPVVADSWR